MRKKIGNLSVVSYDDTLFEHKKLKRDFLRDPLFIEYFGLMFLKKSDEIFTNSDHFELKKIYLIEDVNQLVGLIRFYHYHESGYLTIQYAVHPAFRKQGYGLKILKEISTFLLENHISCIEGEIDKNNIGSIKIATSLGFSFEDGKYRLRK